MRCSDTEWFIAPYYKGVTGCPLVNSFFRIGRDISRTFLKGVIGVYFYTKCYLLLNELVGLSHLSGTS